MSYGTVITLEVVLCRYSLVLSTYIISNSRGKTWSQKFFLEIFYKNVLYRVYIFVRVWNFHIEWSTSIENCLIPNRNIENL